MSSDVLDFPVEVVDFSGHRSGFPESDKPFSFMSSDFGHSLGITHVSPLQAPRECSTCGEYLAYELMGEGVRVTSACMAGAVSPVTVEVTFSSGQVIVADDLRPVFDAYMADLSYNSTLGQHKFVKRMAETGCAYGPILNTSPNVYKDQEGNLFIASLALDETEPPAEWTEVASICTDLWAYSLADYERWLAGGGVSVEEDDHYGSRTVIDVKPGTYKLTHFASLPDFEHHSADLTIFGKLEIVR